MQPRALVRQHAGSAALRGLERVLGAPVRTSGQSWVSERLPGLEGGQAQEPRRQQTLSVRRLSSASRRAAQVLRKGRNERLHNRGSRTCQAEMRLKGPTRQMAGLKALASEVRKPSFPTTPLFSTSANMAQCGSSSAADIQALADTVSKTTLAEEHTPQPARAMETGGSSGSPAATS